MTKSTAVDSTYIKAQRSGLRRKRGGESSGDRPLTRRSNDRNPRPHDVICRPFALILTPGDVSDITVAPALLACARGTRYVLAAKGYAAEPLRRTLRQSGAVPVIPGRITRKTKIAYDRDRYRDRHLIENAFCRLKDFRRVATR